MPFKLLKSLLMRLGYIHRKIEQEQKARMPNTWHLLRLKKIRLQIKDRIARTLRASRQNSYV